MADEITSNASPNFIRMVAWLVLIAFLAGTVGWIWTIYSEASRQQSVAQSIPGVQKIRTTTTGTVIAIEMSQASDEAVVELSKVDLPDLKIIYILESSLSEKGFLAIRDMQRIEELSLFGTATSEKNARELSKMPNLRKLDQGLHPPNTLHLR